MKKTILFAALLLGTTMISQAQSIRFGVKGGINYANQNGTDITLNSDNYDTEEAITSYHAGLVAEVKLFENFAIQPELLYSTQGATYKNATEEFKNELGYISIPVLAKIYLNNSLSLEVGPQASFLLSERNKFDYKESETFEFAGVVGLGLNVTNNLFLQARYGLGLTEASKDAQTKNSTFQISAGILF
ncbi:porin family protein [Flavobacterium algicola]|uniref:porin family protein n=1 Tax=Flavobacterium algicola TaxID=556529 RepID=UPI001EFDF92C|nr:porin family protein [Flavobacterium algicola]MCG9791139.1 PorT family protein [Flavobacterium algicola]